ncbi:hypothetical protein [Enterococcus sp. LJL51]|uniref:hypothetical protein n=1 Tax=Enterococcus sp. LJL51 TaxID=3416656 RepID=UPI003CEB32FC
MFKKNEQVQVVEWEKVAAQRLKNKFANIEEIRFLEKYNYNHLAGFVAVNVEVITSNGIDTIDVDLPVPENEDYGIGSYGGPIKIEVGKTIKKINVIYSDQSEEEI